MTRDSQTLVFIDTETTGLDPSRNEVIEIAFLKAREIRGEKGALSLETLEEFVSKIKPEHIELALPAALKTNGYSEESWKDAPEALDVYKTLGEKLWEPSKENPIFNDLYFVGHNISFDMLFLAAGFRRLELPFPMPRRALDTYSLARGRLFDIRPEGGYSLGALCDYFGITNKKAHTAMSDVYATYELYKKLFNAKEISST